MLALVGGFAGGVIMQLIIDRYRHRKAKNVRT